MGAAIEPGTAGEQAIAIGDMDHILLRAACSDNGAGTTLFPHINIILGIIRNDALARRAGGGLDAHAVGQRAGQHTIGVRLPQVCLGEERQLVQILHAVDILRLDPGFVHQVPVVGHIGIDMLHRLNQLFRLQRPDLLLRHCFDLRLIIVFFAHRITSLYCSIFTLPLTPALQKRRFFYYST